MKTNNELITLKRIERIREQGYFCYSKKEISELAFGNRFAYQLCTSLLIVGIAFANIPILSTMMVIAFSSVLLPNHPFDYIYNYILSDWMELPKLPRRSIQLKFACSIATIWIGSTIYLFHNNLMVQGYIAGAVFITLATIVSLTDICIPSIIFNKILITRNQ